MVQLKIRIFKENDSRDIISLWEQCKLIVPWNNPQYDIDRKMKDSPELFFVGEFNGCIIASCMAGYDGHRGWIYYLAVHPDHRRKSYALAMMSFAEKSLRKIGCPKIDLMIRNTNSDVIAFYKQIGYNADPVVVMSKRLIEDK
ncbi:MAG: GNAT family acetyltransferase [Candidatus Marinimicrobia bacterium]|jgi:ribosomal protein S18 acetylase RimI-like enzyme|nr:GNAT family acetyltransferase [Candidatus Neomarinimicrobiota bacterium]MBT3633991.1 GNAT family acetyltransferase [Candidatus Neomarinimicrobiota bacterium]MBT3683735.1 GNAT family acetyltransferase [Candidatus Neomarinimicrobiota bacterium]MBT3760615.1 GNAT family acetyltransferase [Candidatus Neomarinimicrobiota bacterium]MBT3895774.1 GNAT family acetyltransferase [Candidatus Neomarinimicrobiota bacterium]